MHLSKVCWTMSKLPFLILNSVMKGDTNTEKWVKVYIGLGGNVGNVVSSMVEALKGLNQHPRIRLIGCSSLYATPPWGDVDQDDFINSCALLETSLSPEEFLSVLKDQEKLQKREKTRRWGPRNIDLDILVFENIRMKTPRLEIPHPRMTNRGFVLQPLYDLDKNLRIMEKSISHWLGQADLSGIKKLPDQSGWVSDQ